jgi:phosphoglycolate phosphatase
MGKYSIVIFDLDGTLTDPGAGIVNTIRSVIAELGGKAPRAEELKWCVGPPLREIFTRLLAPAGKEERAESEGRGGLGAAAGTNESKTPSIGEAVGRASALYLQRYAESGAAESVAYQGVNQVLTELRKVARLFVVTSKNTATAERILGMCGLKRYFEEVIGNGRLNDKSDMVRDLIDREGIERATAAMVGDREFDIRAGKNNGIFSIGVTYGYGSRAELEAAGADRLCESPTEVARLLLSAEG